MHFIAIYTGASSSVGVCAHFKDSKELQVFGYCESPKQNVVLRTDGHALADLLHVSAYVKLSNDSSTTSWSIQT